MSVRGLAQKASVEPLGTELVAAALAGATVLYVEDITDFDDDGGIIEINGSQFPYGEDAIDEDALTITLDDPLVDAAAAGDRVFAVSGGEAMSDLMLEVSIGVGDPALVKVPHRDRDLWPEGEYPEPVQVMLSDDLETIEDVPGRVPVRDGAFILNPLAMGYLPADASWPNNTWQTITGWTVFDLEDITYDAVTGKFTIHTAGLYDIRCGVTFALNATGGRAVRPAFDSGLLGPYAGRFIRIPSTGTTGTETNRHNRMGEGDAVYFQAHQDSGAALNLLGAAGLTIYTDFSILRVAP